MCRKKKNRRKSSNKTALDRASFMFPETGISRKCRGLLGSSVNVGMLTTDAISAKRCRGGGGAVCFPGVLSSIPRNR